MSQLKPAEWKRFFELMDKIVHSNELNYREIGEDIIDAAHKLEEKTTNEVTLWLHTFVDIFDGYNEGAQLGLKLDLEMADMIAEDKILQDEDDERNEYHGE